MIPVSHLYASIFTVTFLLIVACIFIFRFYSLRDMFNQISVAWKEAHDRAQGLAQELQSEKLRHASTQAAQLGLYVPKHVHDLKVFELENKCLSESKAKHRVEQMIKGKDLEIHHLRDLNEKLMNSEVLIAIPPGFFIEVDSNGVHWVKPTVHDPAEVLNQGQVAEILHKQNFKLQGVIDGMRGKIARQSEQIRRLSSAKPKTEPEVKPCSCRGVDRLFVNEERRVADSLIHAASVAASIPLEKRDALSGFPMAPCKIAEFPTYQSAVDKVAEARRVISARDATITSLKEESMGLRGLIAIALGDGLNVIDYKNHDGCHHVTIADDKGAINPDLLFTEEEMAAAADRAQA